MLGAGQCYFQQHGEVVLGPVSIWHAGAAAGAVKSALAVDVPAMPAMPELQRAESSICVLPKGSGCDGAAVVVARAAPRANKRRAKPKIDGLRTAERASMPVAASCIIINGPCTEALPVAVAVPSTPPGAVSLRKGAAWLLGLSVANLCLLSPVSTLAATLGIAAAASALCAHDGGTRSSRRVRSLARTSSGLFALTMLVSSGLFARTMPKIVRATSQMCPAPAPAAIERWPSFFDGTAPEALDLGPPPADEVALDVLAIDGYPWHSRGSVWIVSAGAPMVPVEPWLSEAAPGEAAPYEARALRQADGDNEAQACARQLRAVWVLLGVAFVLAVGLLVGAAIAGAYVASEASRLTRHASAPEESFGA